MTRMTGLHALSGPGPVPADQVSAPAIDTARVRRLAGAPGFTAHQLIAELKRDPFLAAQFPRDVGVWERYSLERHTSMVMGQFERYFRGPLPGGIDRAFFRLVIAFHDIGKPQSVAAGDKRLQHEYTVPIMRRYFAAMGYDRAHIELAVAIVAADIIGKFAHAPDHRHLRRPSPLAAATELRAYAQHAGVPPRTFFALVKLLFLVDAGSYTLDAGGTKSLDKLFVFNRGGHRMALAPEPARRLAPLAALFGDRS